MNASQSHTQFVNAVAKEVRFGSTQFVAHLAQALQPEVALVLYFRRQLVKPLDERA
jgi:hypothetical protein